MKGKEKKGKPEGETGGVGVFGKTFLLFFVKFFLAEFDEFLHHTDGKITVTFFGGMLGVVIKGEGRGNKRNLGRGCRTPQFYLCSKLLLSFQSQRRGSPQEPVV